METRPLSPTFVWRMMTGAQRLDGRRIPSCTVVVDVTVDETQAADLGTWVIAGQVVPGEQRGRQLGWPTANVEVSGSELPPDGIFAAWVDINGVAGPRAAAVSVGTNPTFAGTSRCVEAHLLDFNDDIYGAQVTVRATHWLRETRAFDSVPDLLEAITADVAQVRALLCRP